ncbi:MAG: hypothetical protein JSU06_04795 [Actinobacteria bacterium]|nr:hypothetical protein [Actinomycetota bacterium]
MSDGAALEVENVTNALPNDRLWGSFRVREIEGNRLALIGWVLGASAEVDRIDIVDDADTVVATVAPELPRTDIAAEFPDRPAAATCGFELAVEAEGRGAGHLQLRAVFNDGTEAPIGTLSVTAATPDRAA